MGRVGREPLRVGRCDTATTTGRRQGKRTTPEETVGQIKPPQSLAGPGTISESDRTLL